MQKVKMWIVMGMAVLFAATACHAASRKALDKRITDATQYVQDVMGAPDTAIPQALLQNCRGVIILRQYKAGFVFGLEGGLGIALVRDEKTKEWSAPAFIKAGEGSFGFQIGGESVDSIFVIMNRKGMQMLMKDKFKIGADASAAAGPVGRDASANVGPGTDILVYSRAKGLYAGATFEGGILVSDKDANKSFYGKNVSTKGILFQKEVKIPPDAKILINTLEQYK